MDNRASVCVKCERLVRYRESITPKSPLFLKYWNKPVLPSGDLESPWMIIVGLAPGRHGANRTSLNFVGDQAGVLLYRGLYLCGLSNKENVRDYDPQLNLNGVVITNSIRCVPPGNKPTSLEFDNCRPYLVAELERPTLTDVLCIGRDAFNQVHRALKLPLPTFSHGSSYPVSNLSIHASYHTSGYMQNTGRITLESFVSVIKNIQRLANDRVQRTDDGKRRGQ